MCVVQQGRGMYRRLVLPIERLFVSIEVWAYDDVFVHDSDCCALYGQ